MLIFLHVLANCLLSLCDSKGNTGSKGTKWGGPREKAVPRWENWASKLTRLSPGHHWHRQSMAMCHMEAALTTEMTEWQPSFPSQSLPLKKGRELAQLHSEGWSRIQKARVSSLLLWVSISSPLRDTFPQCMGWVGAVVSCLSASYCTGHKETICPPFSPNTLPKIHSDSHFLLLKAELTGICWKYPGSEPFRLKCNGVLERLSGDSKVTLLNPHTQKVWGGRGREAGQGKGENRKRWKGWKLMLGLTDTICKSLTQRLSYYPKEKKWGRRRKKKGR